MIALRWQSSASEVSIGHGVSPGGLIGRYIAMPLPGTLSRGDAVHSHTLQPNLSLSLSS
jgi:hypothetical protein